MLNAQRLAYLDSGTTEHTSPKLGTADLNEGIEKKRQKGKEMKHFWLEKRTRRIRNTLRFTQ